MRSFLASIEGFKSFSLGSGACEIEEMRAAGAFFCAGLSIGIGVRGSNVVFFQYPLQEFFYNYPKPSASRLKCY